MRVAVIQSGIERARTVCKAMMQGIARVGDDPILIKEEFYNGPDYDVAVFYGLHGKLRSAFSDFKRNGRKAVYIDLGYWGRRDGGRYQGYHKFSVNSRHPTLYFQRHKHSQIRLQRHDIEPKKWRKDGRHILVAGMGAKAAEVEGFLPEQWEQSAIATLRQHTDRPIVYRPKPSWNSAKEIEGTIFSSRNESLSTVLKDCWAVVTHHSNVGVDALIEGVPVFTDEGVALPLGLSDLTKIEEPVYSDSRLEWASDVSYTQWNVQEMRDGHVWRHLKYEGIVP